MGLRLRPNADEIYRFDLPPRLVGGAEGVWLKLRPLSPSELVEIDRKAIELATRREFVQQWEGKPGEDPPDDAEIRYVPTETVDRNRKRLEVVRLTLEAQVVEWGGIDDAPDPTPEAVFALVVSHPFVARELVKLGALLAYMPAGSGEPRDPLSESESSPTS